MDEIEKAAAEIYSAIANRIRTKRIENGLSLDGLAKKSRFTKSYISQIENLKREPSISTLTKIAFALEVDVFFLITGESRRGDEESITIVKASERKVIQRPSGSRVYVYEPICDKKVNRFMDGYIVTVGPEFPPEPLIHEGQELVYVLEGRQEFFYDGKAYQFEMGDSYCFDSKKPHYSKSLGDNPAKVLVVRASKKETTALLRSGHS